MRGFKRNPWLTGLGVLLTILAVSAGQAWADASIDKKASVLVFPKLVAGENQDTLVQITNTYTSDIRVHCNYVTASCDEFDFDIDLTAQQPTFWRVKTGRFHGAFLPLCRVDDPYCSCQFLPGGRFVCPEILTQFGTSPLPFAEFDGAMYCYEISRVDDSVISRNAIKGEAIIENLKTGDISSYNAIGINGIADSIGDNGLLDLDGGDGTIVDDAGQPVGEYNSCPNWLVLNSYAEGYPEPAFGYPPDVNATVTTEVSLVPCTIDLGFPATSVNIFFNSYDEYEQHNSVTDDMGCVYRRNLSEISTIFGAKYRHSATLATTIEGVGGQRIDGRQFGTGLLGIATETHRVVDEWGYHETSAAFNMFHVYEQPFRLDQIAPFPLCLIQGNCPN